MKENNERKSMNIEQVKEDVANLETKLVTLAEDHNKIQDEMKQLETQFNELRAKRDAIAIEFGQENAVLVKLKGYLPKDETDSE